MGSVEDDYGCPWCGRVGNGGYAPDGVEYPICTGGDHSCLWSPDVDLTVFRSRQLSWILCRNHPFLLRPDVLPIIVSWLGPWKKPEGLAEVLQRFHAAARRAARSAAATQLPDV